MERGARTAAAGTSGALSKDMNITPFQSIIDNPGIRANYVKEQTAPGDAAILRRYLESAGIKTDGSLSAAVTAFQESYNASLADGGVALTPDGKAGPKTLEALRQKLQTQENRGAIQSSQDLKAFLKYQPGTPSLNAAKPEGAVTGAQVLSQPTDAAKRAQLDKKLAENTEPKPTAATAKKAEIAPPTMGALEGEISANKAMIRALQGSPSADASKLRQDRIGGLRTEQATLRGGAEYKAVKSLAEDKAKLSTLENGRMFLPTGSDIETRTTELKSLRAQVAAQEKAVAPFGARIEAEEKRVDGELFALQHRNATPATQKHFDGEIARRTREVVKAEAALERLPEFKARAEYKDAVAKLGELRNDSMFMPTGAQIEHRMKGIEEARSLVQKYESKPRS